MLSGILVVCLKPGSINRIRPRTIRVTKSGRQRLCTACERALAAGVPFRWVAADSVYGVGDIERDLRQAGKGYVLGVNSNHWFASWGKPQRVAGTAEEIAKTQRRSDWRRLSAGAGTKGPRLHD
jgi:SRSO17 transposase